MSTGAITPPGIDTDDARAALVRQRLAGRRRARRSAIPRADRSAPLRLSYGQEQMWFLDRLDPDSTRYLVPLLVRLTGALDAGVLADAWQRLTDRHEILRTRYALHGEEPVQIVSARERAALPLEDLTHLPADERETRVRAIVTGELFVPFDLERDLPVRARLIRLGDAEHVLAVVFHHIACDAWSTEVIGQELSALYTALVRGEEPRLPEVAVQYADFAAWQRAEMSGATLERHLDHWKEQLAGISPIELPTDRPRKAVRDAAGDTVAFSVPAELASRLREFAQERTATPFMVVLAAFQSLLARHTGSADVTVGTVVSGRGRPELQGMLGYGINTLALRGSWADGTSFGELVDATKDTVLGAFDHQGVPFAQLIDAVQPERDLSRNPLFDVALTMHGERTSAFALPGIVAEPFRAEGDAAKYDLDLQLRQDADGTLHGHLEYAVELFDRTTAERLTGQLVRLLDAATAAPDADLAHLSFLGDDEVRLLIRGAAVTGEVTRTVHQVFEEQAARTPDAVAVHFAGEELTYAELDERANRVAHHLIGLGVGQETLVGVCLERGTDLLPALLGVLKAGGAYLPLDPSQPADRIGYMLQDAAAPVVVTERAHAGLFDGLHDGPVLVLVLDGDEGRAALAAAPATDPGARTDADSLIYVIYTSGSTGRPKGVGLTHANVRRLFTVTAHQTGFRGDDVWTLFHSYAFDFSVWEMWGALLHGGRLVVVPKDVARDPSAFLDLLVEQRVTVLNQTPSAFRALVAAAREGDPRTDRLALRTVVFGGEKLEVADLRPWADRLGLDAPTLVNMYGITETTVHVTHHRLDEDDLARGAVSPVGVPLDDLAVRILDAHGNLAPIGVPGEIHVAGRGVARGYLGRPALTAERFVPDPYGAPGDRLYRSGDVARRLADGSLEFLGRNDAQVKIRGFRVELGEINAALGAQDGVRDAVVLVRDDSQGSPDSPGSPGDKQLVAYVVPAEGAAPDTAGLRAALARELPEYMVPATFVTLDALPLTVNGKLDTKALPAPAARVAGTEYTAPRTGLEERTAAVWGEVLGHERVGVHDSFFDLGGHSLRAITLAGRLREAGLDVSVRDLFEHRTVALLCERLADRAPVTATHGVRPFALVGDEDRARLPEGLADAYPMSQVQLGMVVEMLSDSGRHPYHNVTSFRVPDNRSFDIGALRASVASAVARHEVLRTSFDLNSYAVPMQLVHESVEPPVQGRDLRGLDDEAVRDALRAFTAQERSRLIPLDSAPQLRLYGTACDDGSWWLTITECHAILDGWSHHSLLMEIVEGYHRARAGQPVAAPAAPAVRFADFIAAEVASRETGEDRAYWTGVIEGHAPFALPEAWAGDGVAGAPHRVKVPFHDLEPRLRALASTAGVSLKSVLHAAHLKTLSTVTGDERFFTGLVCNARPEALGADGLYGMHLNTLPFAFDGAAGSWRDLVRRVFEREVELWPHRGYPMPDIQRQAETDAPGGRLVSVRFSYHDFDQVDRERVDYLASIDDSPTEFPLGVSARLGHLFLTGGRKHVSAEALERLAGTLREVLVAMAADPEGDASASYLPSATRESLLEQGTGESAGFGDASVCARFEDQAARTPDAPAVSLAATTWTYAELDARADRLAHHLRASGVSGPGSVVGVLLDRGPELLASLLGVWKAGAAYVPIDPSYPAERIASMLDSAGAATALTHSAYADRFGAGIGVLALDRDEAAVAARPATRLARTDDADSLAYVIFTSGSTGRPKGVAVTHRGLANHVVWAARDLASRGTTGAPLFSSVAFDLVVPNLWAPLVTGQQVHTIAQHTDTADLARELAAAGPFSFIKLTPGHVDVLASQLSADEAAALAPVLVIAGEALTRTTVERWRALAPDTDLINEYGPTEASVGTCVFPVTEAETGEVMPIGRPLPNMTMYVLDARLDQVAVGVPGELYVGGTGVARGYASRPALTAERFVPDPYGPAGARLYRTGDLARTRPDGAVEFLGRLDDQVKIRGYRIEPGEVQTVVAEHPEVREAVVVPHETATGDLQLVAYYVPLEAGASVDGLAEHAADRLPDYMLPAAYLALDEIPLNANGKTDKRALPSPDDADTDGGTAYVAPRTHTEAQVAAIWSQVLGLDRVGVLDGFFDLGGHSIRAVALVGALRAAGFDVGVREVFEYRTVAELSEFLTGRPAPQETAPPVEPFALLADEDRARLPEGVVDAYPMSQVQLGMLVEMLADDTRRVYLNVASFRITDGTPFDADALRAALDAVTGRHEMLRTSFDLDAFTAPLQLVHPAARIPLSVEDLRQLSEGARELRVRDIMGEERTRGLDLAAAPLLRMTAQVEADDSWRLVVTVSHAITEGWSHRALLMELLDVYRALREGRAPAPVEAPPVRYADFIAAELASLDSAEDRTYWQDVIGRYAPFTLPAGWAGSTAEPSQKYRLAVPVHDLEPRLRALATQAQVSFKSVLLAAHLKVMSTLTEEDGFFSGLVCSARPESPGAERVYGMYLNTLPFAFDRTAGSWTDLVRQVFAREAEVWDRRRFPMPVIQRDAGTGRLLHVRFSYQDFDHVDNKLVDAGASGGEGGTEFALAVSAVSGHLLLTTHTHALAFAEGERLTALYRQVLESMAADPQGSAQDTYLPAEEREWLLARNDTARDFPEATVLRRFEEQAARTPDAVAVRHAGGEVSYARLDALATRFAYRLRAAGVGAESTVGVLLDRGPELLATLLAVWKAGGAYVPIDPSYPAERIASMCESAAATLAVTQEAYADRFPGAVSVLDVTELAADNGEFGAVARVDDLERLAYVIFTSGSTGRPKGVQVPHRGLANHVAWAADELAVRGTGGAPLFSSVAFDLVVPNLWGPLVTGQAVHVVPQDTLPADLSAALLDGGPYSFVKLTPGHLDILTEQLTTEQVDRLSQVYVVAGEALPGATANQSLEVLGSGRMINEYGPTEASVGSTIHPVTAHVPLDVVPIGRPLPNMTAYVLDAAMREVPAGVLGELYVGGTGVARGYAGRPDLTAERFVPDPYGPAGSRLYRTGDRVRMLADGNIEFLGRLDDQVKIRGYRVELGEVQAVLAALPTVRDAVVAVHEPTPGDKRLVAYLVPEEGRQLPDAAALADDCGALLPEYMVPSAFVTLDAVPLNANGKVDRKALAAPDRSAMRSGRDFVAPRTDTERMLAKIWSEVLGVDEIGVHDEFFELGGHSILMIQVLAAARREGLAVSVWRMYQHGTLIDLAAAIDEDSAAADAAAAVVEEAPAAEPARVEVPAELLASLLKQAAGGDATRLAEGPLAEVAALLGGETRATGTVALGDLESLMAEHQVPGVSLALLGADGSVRTHAAGVLAVDGDRPVTPDTLFQVGSISKHVTAFATLRLVAEGRIALDDPIEAHLTSWHLDELDSAPGAVTVRQLLGHTAGLARHRSVGFPPGGEVPTLGDLLEGTGIVSTPRVRRQLVPGSTFRKSSTHYWVLQQLLEDVTGEAFQDLAHRLVLAPLAMTGSSFGQDFPATAGRPVALGHHVKGVAMEGGWRARAHLAAAGLWTTAGDLAKLARQIRASLLGHEGALLPRTVAQELLATHPGSFYGLGTIVDDTGSDAEFGHGGEPAGYWNLSLSHLGSGVGLVALTNSDSGKSVVKQLTARLGKAEEAFGKGELMADWASAGTGTDAPADHPLLSPVVTDEERA
ncbi:amino acid adenylation domain-containing protein [Streptomyces kunmingensis]|uniref:Amino acid adenylation domain-containing protein n=1 Tax=Streptomyces kunmingensis TaxID=68225 RepID=A0ABU6CG96_9ACTN|nr:non-ribosomal peptide synthetase [Streptomyces kunmingensis]MEB3963727.1 amino acid adenylation domain-containing protein [Streptomyces kunmingensis]